MLCQNKLGDPYFFIAFLKCSKHNYQLDQVLENFKYSFYFDGITLIARHKRFSDLIILLHCFVWRTIPFNLSELKKGKQTQSPTSLQTTYTVLPVKRLPLSLYCV